MRGVAAAPLGREAGDQPAAVEQRALPRRAHSGMSELDRRPVRSSGVGGGCSSSQASSSAPEGLVLVGVAQAHRRERYCGRPGTPDGRRWAPARRLDLLEPGLGHGRLRPVGVVLPHRRQQGAPPPPRSSSIRLRQAGVGAVLDGRGRGPSGSSLPGHRVRVRRWRGGPGPRRPPRSIHWSSRRPPSSCHASSSARVAPGARAGTRTRWSTRVTTITTAHTAMTTTARSGRGPRPTSRPGPAGGSRSRQAGSKSGSQTSSQCSNVTRTGMPIRTSSISTLTRLVVSRRPSCSGAPRWRPRTAGRSPGSRPGG